MEKSRKRPFFCFREDFLYPFLVFLALAIHAWTVAIAFGRTGFLAAFASLVLPVLAQAIWFVKVWIMKGTVLNPYCLAILLYAACWVVLIVRDKKRKAVGREPKEVEGADPEVVSLYPDSIRTSYTEVVEGGDSTRHFVYVVKANRAKVGAFFQAELKDQEWDIAREDKRNGEYCLEALKEGKSLHIMVGTSNKYSGYTRTEIVLKQ